VLKFIGAERPQPTVTSTPTIETCPTIEPEHHSRPDDNFETEWLELLTT
jgi:hypothetical protein